MVQTPFVLDWMTTEMRFEQDALPLFLSLTASLTIAIILYLSTSGAKALFLSAVR